MPADGEGVISASFSSLMTLRRMRAHMVNGKFSGAVWLAAKSVVMGRGGWDGSVDGVCGDVGSFCLVRGWAGSVTSGRKRRPGGTRGGACSSAAQDGVLIYVAYVVAFFLHGKNIAFCYELLIRIFHCYSAYAQIACKTAL